MIGCWFRIQPLRFRNMWPCSQWFDNVHAMKVSHEHDMIMRCMYHDWMYIYWTTFIFIFEKKSILVVNMIWYPPLFCEPLLLVLVVLLVHTIVVAITAYWLFSVHVRHPAGHEPTVTVAVDKNDHTLAATGSENIFSFVIMVKNKKDGVENQNLASYFKLVLVLEDEILVAWDFSFASWSWWFSFMIMIVLDDDHDILSWSWWIWDDH